MHALYDYEATQPDELSFNFDDEIIINGPSADVSATLFRARTLPLLSRLGAHFFPLFNQGEPGWLSGTLQETGQTGIFPANYVEAPSF